MFRSFIREMDMLSAYSRKVIPFCFWISTALFVLAAASFFLAEGPAYFEWIAIHRAAMEAAPSSFVAGLMSSLLCDLISRSRS